MVRLYLATARECCGCDALYALKFVWYLFGALCGVIDHLLRVQLWNSFLSGQGDVALFIVLIF